MSDFVRVGMILGSPMAADPTRPNALGRATPFRDDPMDFPRYRTMKACRNCHRNYEGWSFMPQCDDDEIQGGWCDACVNSVMAARRRKYLEEDLATFGHLRNRGKDAPTWRGVSPPAIPPDPLRDAA